MKHKVIIGSLICAFLLVFVQLAVILTMKESADTSDVCCAHAMIP